MKAQSFTGRLMQWHTTANNRTMPWKGEKDPYKVWLSEIILQQTRVEQGWSYYQRFVEQYPNITSLAAAPEEEVFKLWEGLGYYSRCKNLLFTARYIVRELGGAFPGSFEGLVALKGVGEYTAAAIASFCFSLPHAVVDGNVLRVLARVFGDATPIDTTTGKKKFRALAAQLLDPSAPGIYNQAIMDFGATVCKPALPLCARCPLSSICKAFREGTVSNLPVKEKAPAKKRRWLHYLVIETKDRILIRKRTSRDIWQNLHEFYPLETPHDPAWHTDSVPGLLEDLLDIRDAEVLSVSPARAQQLTHQRIDGYFIRVSVKEVPSSLNGNENLWVEKTALQHYAFPAYIRQNVVFEN